MLYDKGKILAIDFGDNHVGLALSDVDRQMAFPYKTISNFGSLVKLFAQLQLICQQEQVGLVVMGLPFDEEGLLTPQTERIQKIGRKLEVALGNVPFCFIDEAFSSFEADKFLENINIKASRRKKTEDELAAVLILLKYMDKK